MRKPRNRSIEGSFRIETTVRIKKEKRKGKKNKRKERTVLSYLKVLIKRKEKLSVRS